MITSPLLSLPKLSHGFFTREGGVSTGAYASLNVGYGSGDALENVAENRLRIARALGSELPDVVSCYQIHSSKVHVVTDQASALSHKVEADALVTTTRGVAIGVLTADCVPVLFTDVAARVIGAAHAGWRGLHAGVLQNTIQAMEDLGAKRTNIIAAIGPCIADVSYEVGADVHAVFTTQNTAYAHYFNPAADGLHYGFDIGGLAENMLLHIGIAKCARLNYDTYRDESRFFSYRRSTHRSQAAYGRQLSALMLK